MDAKEKIKWFCKLPAEMQTVCREPLLKTLEEFLQTCEKEDLDILNYDGFEEGEQLGMHLTSETIAMIGAYGTRFFNIKNK